MTAVLRHELSSYFTNVTGYVFGAFLLLFAGIYTMVINLQSASPYFEYVLMNMDFIFLIIVPILTMRVIAEERRQKTDQLLYSLPLTMTQVALGKYLAMLVIFLIPVALMAFCPLIIAMNGEARLLSDYASLFAFFLMGCVFLAIGMFLSSLTESQIIAAVSTFAVLLILYLWDSLTGFLPSALGDLLSAFSFTQTFYNFVQYSVFDLGGLVLYLSLAGLFVFLTIQGMQKRRWS